MFPELYSSLLITLFVVWVYVTLGFIISLLIKRNDIADVMWGPGIAIVGATAFLLQSEHTFTMYILLALVIVWAVRLALHIGSRNLKKKEDRRYAAWREEWGKWFVPRSYAQVFLLQGLLMTVVGYSFVHASIFDTGEFGLLAMLGVLIWVYGFIFEAVGDLQLRRFLAKPENKGRIMKYGLWKFTRHPNYFGEVSQWWGIWLIVASMPYSYIALVSPLMITFLILYVSGIPMTEKPFEGNPEFEEYKSKTSAFFPLPPKA